MSSADRGDIRTLIDIMARLRDPDGGCPWDLEQAGHDVDQGADVTAVGTAHPGNSS